MRWVNIAAGALVTGFMFGCATVDRYPDPGDLVNTAHLEAITERVELDGNTVSVVHIYAEAPDYHPVTDDDEGFTCVDDVARAARFYLNRYQRTGDKALLVPAKEMLRFLVAMQTPEGNSYNFLFPDLSINRDHKNSVAQFGWWAARGFRSIALGVKVFEGVDDLFREELLSAGERSLMRLEEINVHRTYTGYPLGKDVASVIVLGLLDWKAATDDPRADALIDKFASWVYAGRHEPTAAFPHVVHEPWKNLWHAWGQLQVEALARAGADRGREEWLTSARDEAESWNRRFLIVQPIAFFEFVGDDTTGTRLYAQIAYDLNCVVQGNRALYDITGDESFATTAEVAGSWFFGNNITGDPMYDTATGRGYDGIIAATERNLNSGAESTIESLLALEALAGLPDAGRMMALQRVPQEGTDVSSEFSGGGITVRFSERDRAGWYDIEKENRN